MIFLGVFGKCFCWWSKFVLRKGFSLGYDGRDIDGFVFAYGFRGCFFYGLVLKEY